MSTPSISLLAGLVGGYTKAQDEMRLEKIKGATTQRDQMLQYLGHLASNPNIPSEHQQWALGKIQELVQADPTKKMPKVDLTELPPVAVKQPPRQATPQLPGMTLQPPVGPGGAFGAPGAPAGAPGASGDVGRASNGTVNVLGAVQPPVGPPVPPGVAGEPPALEAPQAPMTLPAMPQAPVVNPQPDIPISGKGELHVLTPTDRAKYAMATQMEQMNQLQRQFPDKSPEELAHFAAKGEFPKPDVHNLAPGAELVDAHGKVIARNTEPKPGQKSGYEPKMGPAGPIGVTDVATGGMLTPDEVAANPKAKAVLEQAQAEHQKQQDEQEARDTRKIAAAAEAAQKAADRAVDRKVMGEAVTDAQKSKPMVDLLDTQTAYMDGIANGSDPTPRKDLALIVAAVRAMNPGTVRLPQKELELEIKAGSYGDRFRRWFDTATEGTLPADQRLDLFHIVRDETTKTATSAAENWRQAFKGSKHEEPPTYLKRFHEQPQVNAPEGASDEVWLDDKLVGHVVNGKYVPLEAK